MMENNAHKIIHLVRHGHVEGNDRHEFIGSKTDLSLSARGREEIRRFKNSFHCLEKVQKVYCSPLKRAQESAEMIQSPLAKQIIVDDLKEVDFGDWEGQTFEEVSSSHPKLVEEWRLDDSNFQFPNGEAMSGFYERMQRIASEILKSSESEWLVISHGGVIRTLICHFLGLPLNQSYLFKVSTASLSSVEVWGERGVLSRLNVVGYV